MSSSSAQLCTTHLKIQQMIYVIKIFTKKICIYIYPSQQVHAGQSAILHHWLYSAKQPYNNWLFCGKRPAWCLRHPTHVHHHRRPLHCMLYRLWFHVVQTMMVYGLRWDYRLHFVECSPRSVVCCISSYDSAACCTDCDFILYRLWWCTEYDEITDYRVAKTHRMPYLYRSFSAKQPYN